MYVLPGNFNQRGFAPIALVVLLLFGIAAGTFLVQQRTNLFPKAGHNDCSAIEFNACVAAIGDGRNYESTKPLTSCQRDNENLICQNNTIPGDKKKLTQDCSSGLKQFCINQDAYSCYKNDGNEGNGEYCYTAKGQRFYIGLIAQRVNKYNEMAEYCNRVLPGSKPRGALELNPKWCILEATGQAISFNEHNIPPVPAAAPAAPAQPAAAGAPAAPAAANSRPGISDESCTAKQIKDNSLTCEVKDCVITTIGKPECKYPVDFSDKCNAAHYATCERKAEQFKLETGLCYVIDGLPRCQYKSANEAKNCDKEDADLCTKNGAICNFYTKSVTDSQSKNVEVRYSACAKSSSQAPGPRPAAAGAGPAAPGAPAAPGGTKPAPAGGQAQVPEFKCGTDSQGLKIPCYAIGTFDDDTEAQLKDLAATSLLRYDQYTEVLKKIGDKLGTLKASVEAKNELARKAALACTNYTSGQQPQQPAVQQPAPQRPSCDYTCKKDTDCKDTKFPVCYKEQGSSEGICKSSIDGKPGFCPPDS